MFYSSVFLEILIQRGFILSDRYRLVTKTPLQLYVTSRNVRMKNFSTKIWLSGPSKLRIRNEKCKTKNDAYVMRQWKVSHEGYWNSSTFSMKQKRRRNLQVACSKTTPGGLKGPLQLLLVDQHHFQLPVSSLQRRNLLAKALLLQVELKFVYVLRPRKSIQDEAKRKL